MPRLMPVLLALLLMGCVANLPTDHDPAKDPAKGVVIVSVTQQKEPWSARGASLIVTLAGRGGSNGIEVASAPWNLEDDAHGLAGRLYVIELPAGPARLSGWRIQDGLGELQPRVPPPPLSFQVGGGRAVYIGNVHGVYEAGGSVLGLLLIAGGMPEIRDASERDIPMALAMYPRLAGKIDAAPLPVGPWGTGGSRRVTDPMQFLLVPRR